MGTGQDPTRFSGEAVLATVTVSTRTAALMTRAVALEAGDLMDELKKAVHWIFRQARMSSVARAENPVSSMKVLTEVVL